nr:hypothetical protein [Escherichia coli]
MLELDEMVNRREEWMCAQVLFTGRLILLVKVWMTQFIFGLKRKEINHILN